MPTLAELKSQKSATVPKSEVTVTLIEGQHVLAEGQRLQERRADLRVSRQRLQEQVDRDAEARDEEAEQRTRKGGQKAPPPDPRLAQIEALDAEIADLDEQVRVLADERLPEFQGVVALTGVTGGEWQRWKDEHPAREDNRTDVEVTAGRCNATDLFKALGEYVSAWDGEPVSKDDWDGWLGEKITYADRRDLVTAVVSMHEVQVVRLPKSSSGSSTTETSETA